MHLRAAAVLERFGIDSRRSGAELRTALCPTCGARSRPDTVCSNTSTGMWCCKAHQCKGDVFALVAGYSGLDIKREFGRVLEVAAEIAGVTAQHDHELEQRLAMQRRQLDEQRKHDDAARAAARSRMPSVWASLEIRSLVGERYLDGRGITSRPLRERGRLRFSNRGEPAVPLYDLATGELVGIQYRCLDGDKKLRCEPGSQVAGSALAGRVGELDTLGVDVAVLVEGLADSLAAQLAFPGCAVFGASGAEQMARIAMAVAPRIVELRGWLLVVTDDDEAGLTNAEKAVRAARAVGLQLDRDLLLVDVGNHHDLADAWRAGWRWQWPQERGGVG